MSTSDFRFFRVPEPSLNVLTFIYLFRRKVTKPTITYYEYCLSFPTMTTVQYVLKYIVQMMFVALYQMRKRTSLDHPYSV